MIDCVCFSLRCVADPAEPVPVQPGGHTVPGGRGHQGHLPLECECDVIVRHVQSRKCSLS